MPYDWLVPVVASPFVGSFLTVLAVRVPAGEEFVRSRSRCRQCDHQLQALDLVPIVSWIFLAGRCRACRQPISVLYPATEIAAVVVAVWASLVMEGALLWITIAFGWTLVALAAMDIRSLVLADVLTLPLIVAGLSLFAVLDPDRLWLHLSGAAVGFALMVAVAFAYRLMRGREGMGFGDAKLMAAAGAWTGLYGIGSVLFYAAATGLIFAVFVGSKRSVSGTTQIPLGAGIALGMWLVWVHGPLALG